MTKTQSDPTTRRLTVTCIPAFHDNYLWLIDNGEQAAVVDPGDAGPVIDELERRELQLATVLVTHHHPDHTGGLQQLKDRYDCEILGPQSPHIPQVERQLHDGDHFELFGYSWGVIEVPGHTLDHIAYFLADTDPPKLFCGDTLFAGGCGRVFEGSFEQMRSSLDKLRELPTSTMAYCAHEYTTANLQFALAVEPENAALLARIEQVREQREQGLATVPSQLATELATNPFLRFDQPGVISAAQHRSPAANGSDAVFAEIRRWKDSF